MTYEQFEAVQTVRDEQVDFAMDIEELHESLTMADKAKLLNMYQTGNLSYSAAKELLGNGLDRLISQKWPDREPFSGLLESKEVEVLSSDYQLFPDWIDSLLASSSSAIALIGAVVNS